MGPPVELATRPRQRHRVCGGRPGVRRRRSWRTSGCILVGPQGRLNAPDARQNDRTPGGPEGHQRSPPGRSAPHRSVHVTPTEAGRNSQGGDTGSNPVGGASSGEPATGFAACRVRALAQCPNRPPCPLRARYVPVRLGLRRSRSLDRRGEPRGDVPLAVPVAVLVDQRRPGAPVAHPGHRVPQAGTPRDQVVPLPLRAAVGARDEAAIAGCVRASVHARRFAISGGARA